MEHGRPLVLIAEDDAGVLKMLSTLLEMEGYEVLTAANGREVLGAVNERAPDILLLSILLPEMDGFEVLERLGAGHGLPVIAFSANREHGEKALRLGAASFFTKPFDIDRLTGKVRDILGRPG